MKIEEITKEYAKIHYPGIFDLEAIPGNYEEAYEIFNNLSDDKKPDGVENLFKCGDDGWCDIYETAEGKIAVYGDGMLSNSSPLWIIKL